MNVPEPTTHAGGLTRRDWMLALGVALAAALLHLALCAQRGFWYDEYLTLNAAEMNLADLCQNRLKAGHSPLYFIFAKLGPLLGHSLYALRLTSPLATFLLILGLTATAGALGLRRCLPALWFIALFEPYWITLGTQMRYMMPMLAVAAWAAWGGVRFAADPSRRNGIVFALLLGLLLWLHASTQFFLVGFAVFLAWDAVARNPGRRRALLLAGRLWPVLLGFVLSLPLVYLIRHHSSSRTPSLPRWQEFKVNLTEVVFGYYGLWPEFLDFKGRPFFYLQAAVLLGAILMARRELLRRGLAGTWRALFSLILSIPLALVLAYVLVRNFGNAPRYLALFALPCVFCLAVAWSAEVRPALRWIYRLALVGLLAVQAAGTAVERGDRHGEGCRWLVDNAAGQAVVINSSKVSSMGIHWLGFSDDAMLVKIEAGAHDDIVAERALRQAFAKCPRVLYMTYYRDNFFNGGLKRLRRNKSILEERRWRLSGRVTVGALIRDERDRVWLEALPDPQKSWGPCRDERGD